VRAAAASAGLGDNYHAVEYQRPLSLGALLLGARTPPARPEGSVLEVGRLRQALTPRVWYLAPGYEAAGLLTSADGPSAKPGGAP
jgi:hypothetical protein